MVSKISKTLQLDFFSILLDFFSDMEQMDPLRK